LLDGKLTRLLPRLLLFVLLLHITELEEVLLLQLRLVIILILLVTSEIYIGIDRVLSLNVKELLDIDLILLSALLRQANRIFLRLLLFFWFLLAEVFVKAAIIVVRRLNVFEVVIVLIRIERWLLLHLLLKITPE